MSLAVDEVEEVLDAHFIPLSPRDAYFDATRQAWILSRYRDVQAALRERRLHQASPRGEVFPGSEDKPARAEAFAQVKSEIAEIQRGRWRAEMEFEARSVLCHVDGRNVIDLLGGVALPWSIAMLRKMSGAPASCRIEVARISASLFYKKAFGMDLEDAAKPLWLRAAGTPGATVEAPEAELDALIARGDLAISKMMFLAVSQSLPAFLAKAWLALMLHPGQMKVLAAAPERMPHATSELLRYAGIVHTLHRKAAAQLELGSARIAAGERVELRVASANFDPERFREPQRLDITRAVQSHVSLGAGLHACAGAALVRQAFAATMPVFLASNPRLIEPRRTVWMGDSTLRWPLAVWAS